MIGPPAYDAHPAVNQSNSHGPPAASVTRSGAGDAGKTAATKQTSTPELQGKLVTLG